ncbi:MAG: cytochrome-c peroxidase [Myxococcota bacterium]
MKRAALPVVFALSALLVACNKEEPKPAEPAPATNEAPAAASGVTIDPARLGSFGPLPASYEVATSPSTEEKVTLGRMLYYENRLSRSHELSCNSCHMLEAYGVDNQPTSPGHKAQRGGRNSPTVYNAAGHIQQFWDGRAEDVEAQAKGPILNPIEMAMKDEASVVATLKSMPEYEAAFKAAFPGEADPVSYDNMAKAIGAFERKLVTPARWDKFLGGDQGALTDAEKAGFNAFVDAGCLACHTGALVGGGMYQKLGLVTPWPNATDVGRFEVTKNEADKGVFKVPSLRNVEKAAPYFHDGSVATLSEAITLMGKHQLGKELTPEQVTSIETWLKTLTGELPTAYIAKPTLPPSSEKTPKPDKT